MPWTGFEGHRQSWLIFRCDKNKPRCCYHAASHPVTSSQCGAAVKAPPPPPYGHSEPQQPLQAFTALESNWAECVGINYPIIQHRHAIKGVAAITRCRHRPSHVTVTQRGRRLPFFCSAEGGVDARTDTRKGRAHISCTLPDRIKTPQMIYKQGMISWFSHVSII